MMPFSKHSGNSPHSLIHKFIMTALGISAAWTINGCGPKIQLTPLQPSPPPIIAENGMVVAAHPLASEAGLNVLKEGGNAVDAALAALFMLNVVEPNASGLAGGGFAVIRTAKGEEKVVVYRERAPRELDVNFYLDPADTNHSRMANGGSAVCVPGAPAGWAELYDNWATLPLERLARDAIRAAEEGFIVDPTLAGQIKGNYDKLQKDSLLTRTFLRDGVIPYEPGDTLRQPDLAATFRFLVEHGLRSFYRGPIAEAIVEASRGGGGFLSATDFEFYRAELKEPLTAQFEGKLQGFRALTAPPPTGGGAALLEALHLCGLTSAWDYPQRSPEAIHLMAQCLQQADADAAAQCGDPLRAGDGWKQMANRESARSAAEGISLKTKPGPRPAAINLAQPGNTTHLVVVDKWGNAVSLTQSINWFFGAGVMAPGTGLVLNNQMADFNLPPDSVNVLAGGMAPRSNMAPLILLKDGKTFLVAGTPGGARIMSAMTQIVTNAVIYGDDISRAIDLPRFFPVKDELVMENRADMITLKRLKKMGYKKMHLAPPYHVYFGGAHAIMIDDKGALAGAADRRRGGSAKGY